VQFNKHSQIAGTHAFLSPSNSSWSNYDDDKLDAMFASAMTAARGTRLHNLAHELISMGVKLPDTSASLNQYVNDGIGYRMASEQTLFYSVNCYGSADTIAFRQNILRIHDLKNGVSPASFRQLEIYTALFCLEYKQQPFKINTELRIYQMNEVKVHLPDPDDIMHIMAKIKYFDKRIDSMREEATR
jgi:hypothetical protein